MVFSFCSDKMPIPARTGELNLTIRLAGSLADLELFLSVSRHRSFARAAAERSVSRSAVSHAISSLEGRLGVRLLNRTTRSVTPTEVGQALLAELEPAMGEVARALDAVNVFRDTPVGTLRLNVPRSATLVLASLIGRFAQANPKVRVEIVTDDGFVDVVRAGFDAGIRFGESLARDMIAIPIGPRQRFAVVAAPDYFARKGMPKTPQDLVKHDCIQRRFPSGATFAWEFAKRGRSLKVAVDGQMILDDSTLTLAAARAGLGLAFLFEQHTAVDIASGRLVRMLEDWCPHFPGFYLYYPSRRQMPGPLKAFVEFISHAR